MNELSAPRYIMPMIISEQQLQTLSCVHYTIFSVVKLDFYIRALLLDHILSRKKNTRTSCFEWLAVIILLCLHVIKMLLAMLIRQWAQI